MTDDVEEERDIDIRVVKRFELKGNANKDDLTIIAGKALDNCMKRTN